MKIFNWLGGVAFAVCLISNSISSAFAADVSARTVPTAKRQITQSVNIAAKVPMRTSVPAEATAANDQGIVDDAMPLEHLMLVLHRPSEQADALETLMQEQVTPGSPNYHKWLTAEQFGEYGVAQEDIAAVTQWLRTEGFKINSVHPNRMLIDFSGTAGSVAKSFNTELHHLQVNGELHLSNMSAPQMPAAFADAVVGLVALNDFRPKPAMTISNGQATEYMVTPADLATIYNINPLWGQGIDGNGQTIAIISNGDLYSIDDVVAFRSKFGLPTGSSFDFSVVHPNCDPAGVIPEGEQEAALDAEYAGAAAPAAALRFVSCASSAVNYGPFLAMVNLLAQPSPPPIWTYSYILSEAVLGESGNVLIEEIYQQAAAEGVSVFVASGDDGAAQDKPGVKYAQQGIGVNGLASTRYNVAVGGTDFSDMYLNQQSTYWNTTNTGTFGSAKSYVPEMPWNSTCASVLTISYINTKFGTNFSGAGTNSLCNNLNSSNDYLLTTLAGGGGKSACALGSANSDLSVGPACQGRAKPWWQVGVRGTSTGNVRDIPDVSLFSANAVWSHGYVFCMSDTSNGGRSCAGSPTSGNTWIAGGAGTSFASPIVAGIHALVNQKVGSRTGNPNPVYYALANAQFASTGSGGCDANKGNASDASCVFHDIRGLSVTLGGTTYTTGTAVPCLHDTPDCLTPSGSGTYGIISQSASSFSQAYPAGIGWDYATGLGSINATNLVNNWPHDAATQLAFVVQPDANYAPGALIEVEVVAEDANGLPVDADVTLSLQGGDPTAVLSGSHCCNVNTSGGVATFDMSVDKPNMNYQLVATAGNLTTTSTAFTIATSNLKFTTQPASSTKAGDLFTTKISIVDGNGKVVTGSNAWIYLGLTGGAPGALLFDNVNVPASVVSIQAVNGVATLQRYATVAAKNYQIEAVSPGLNGASSNVFAVTAGTPAGIVFTAQPPTSWPASESFSTTVAVQDKFGNTVSPWNFSARVALYDASGTGQKTISGTLTQPMSTGTATFSGLSIATPGSYVLKVFSGSYTTTSTVINITAPASLVFDEQPPKTVNAGVPFEVKVAAVDASGVNKIASFNGPISLSLVGSGGSLDGTTTVNAVSGEATFGGLSVGTPGSYRLKANLTDTVVFSDSFTVTTAPTSVTLAFSTVPATVQAGSPFGVAVSTFDQANNLITTPTTIKLKLLGGGDLGGTLSGTLQAVTSGGTAQFNGLSINTAASYQLEASATGAVSATSGTLTVVPAAFSKLVFITQPVGILQDRPLSAIAVAEEDAFDNILTQDDTSSISFTVPACGGNVALGTATVSNGIALLSNSQIKFRMVASSLQVTASTQGVSALSDPFAVATDIGLVYYGGFEGCQL